ncbi:MAG: PP2C family protein-serine/threonine phosphatase [Kofleriaceae bacterium]|nr:PP2C family protein-serine/threonine phosphatase [Kofleriaceae bacterium]
MLPLMGMVSLDEQRIVTACDAGFCTAFQCADAEVIGLTIDELLEVGPALAGLGSLAKPHESLDLLGALRIRERAQLARVRLRRSGAGYALHAEAVHEEQDVLYRASVLAGSWAAMFRESREGALIIDTRGCVLEHNDAFRTLLDLDDGSLVGRPVAELLERRFPRLALFLREPSGELLTREKVGAATFEMKAGAITAGAPLGAWVLLRDLGPELAREAAVEAHERDLGRARVLQRALFSRPAVSSQYTTEIVYRPLQHIGGDAYDITVLPDRVRLFIADATGHGVAAALVAMIAKSTYDAIKHDPIDASAVLATLNDRVANNMRGADGMFTAAIVDVMLATRTLVHAVAAHPPPLLAHDGAVEPLEFGGTFMGVVPGRRYPSWTRPLEPGAAVYLVTDGIEETRNADGTQFGTDRIRETLAEAVASRGNSCKALIAKLDAWAGPVGIDDDITIIGLRDQGIRKQ